jgi:hypothetical protein
MSAKPERLMGTVVNRFLLKERNWRRWHDGRDGMFIDQLRLSIPAEQDTKIIKPGYNALQLYTIHQKHGDRSLGLSHRIEKNILQII